MALKYEIALLSVWFSKNSPDTRFFESVEAQTAYFQNLVGGGFSSLVNFNIGNNINTVINYTDKTDKTLYELLACNYAVVRITENDVITYRYFFASVEQVSGRNINVTLELDDIQTNYFKYKDTIAPCTINRACLSRFIGDTATFNLNADSPLFCNEGIDLPKRLTSRQRVVPNIDTTLNSGLNQLLQNIGVKWVIVMVQHTNEFKEYGNIPTLKIGGIDTGQYCLVAPLGLLFRGGTQIWNDRPLWNILKGSSASLVTTVKITPVCPLNVTAYEEGEDYDFTNDVTQDFPVLWFKNLLKFNIIQNEEGGKLFGLTKLSTEPAFYDIPNPIQYSFNKNQIIDQPKNILFNPKLLSAGAKSINIVDYYGNSFAYDLQKLGNTPTLRLLFTEILTPEQTKGYVRFEDSGLYTNGSDNNYTGLVYSNDNVITYLETAYGAFLAQNKNFNLIQQAQRDYNVEQQTYRTIRQGLNIATGIATGNYIGAALNTLNMGSDWAQTLSQNNLSKKMESFTIDNMRSAPGSIHNAQGNIFNPLAIFKDLSFFIEIYDGLDIDKEKFNDYTFMYGYEYQVIDSLANVDNIRVNFNYIEAQVEAITAPISNKEKDRLRARLRSIRFWNTDEINYTMENYERGLLNG